MTVNRKLCINIFFNTSRNICFGYLLIEAILINIKTYVLSGNKNKTRSYLHILLLIKDSLEKQIHFNGNIFGNKNAVIVRRFFCIFLEILHSALLPEIFI